MKHLGAMLITLALVVYLLINGTQTGFNTSSIVSVPYDFLTASEKTQVDCLTENIFYEAAHEPRDGQVAVGLVTLNRVKTNVFGKDVCGVVHQKTKHRTGRVVCQFSWLCESKKILTEKHMDLYNNVRDVALYVYFNHGIIDDVTQGAIYYHADYVSPGWHKLQKTTQIGRHIFYIDPKVSSRYDGKT
jgi:spore germination cell wall hydrolase CwlJ-like protein